MTSLLQVAATVTEKDAASIRAAAEKHAGLPAGSRGVLSSYIRKCLIEELERETNGDETPARNLKGPTTQLSGWVPPEMKDRIEAEATARGVSVSALIATALGV